MDFKKWDALNTVMPFGQYQGDTLQYILEVDPSYLQWLFGIVTTGALYSSLDVLREDISDAVDQEKDDLVDYMDIGFDPAWDCG